MSRQNSVFAPSAHLSTTGGPQFGSAGEILAFYSNEPHLCLEALQRFYAGGEEPVTQVSVAQFERNLLRGLHTSRRTPGDLAVKRIMQEQQQEQQRKEVQRSVGASRRPRGCYIPYDATRPPACRTTKKYEEIQREREEAAKQRERVAAARRRSTTHRKQSEGEQFCRKSVDHAESTVAAHNNGISAAVKQNVGVKLPELGGHMGAKRVSAETHQRNTGKMDSARGQGGAQAAAQEGNLAAAMQQAMRKTAPSQRAEQQEPEPFVDFVPKANDSHSNSRDSSADAQKQGLPEQKEQQQWQGQQHEVQSQEAQRHSDSHTDLLPDIASAHSGMDGSASLKQKICSDVVIENDEIQVKQELPGPSHDEGAANEKSEDFDTPALAPSSAENLRDGTAQPPLKGQIASQLCAQDSLNVIPIHQQDECGSGSPGPQAASGASPAKPAQLLGDDFDE